MMEHAPDTQGT